MEIRLEELEKEHKVYKKQQEKKLKELENLLKQKTKKVNERTIPEENSFKCRKCDYTTTSRQGLKIHNAKVHSNVNFEEFPAACDICEKVLDNESSLKKHKKTDHTFHYVKFKCNECDFMAKEEQTLHVHFGLKHSVKKQCGLCDKDFDNSKQLDEHLSQCEIIVCDNNGCRKWYLELSDVREHIQNEHRKNSPPHYSFSYCVLNSKDQSEKEISKKYHTIYPKDW